MQSAGGHMRHRKAYAMRGALSTTASSSPSSSATIKFDFDNIRNEIMNYWLISEAASPKGSTTNARYCCFTYHDGRREYLKPSANWHWLDKELSSNFAGETGAVHIYKGALAALSIRPINDDVLEFCQSHMANEASHLQMFEYIVPDGKRTKLLPIWRLAGFTLGFFPTLLGGSRALYVTVEAVETFVEEHFQDQIVPLKKQNACPDLVKLLESCCEDEVHHKEDAARRLLNQDNPGIDAFWVQPWTSLVRGGSALAAEIARRV
ncbi:unnamed protein product [Cylindrotheca closterium]|uniref:Ubiquinone biosynthesis protein COQ7 n=1 Tax=Cylindrotheca closterium TaxID=2856 RepID=A0AAD2CZA3_9STRA|nr:unnamed protein product [Cylindrotheca closterium]